MCWFRHGKDGDKELPNAHGCSNAGFCRAATRYSYGTRRVASAATQYVGKHLGIRRRMGDDCILHYYGIHSVYELPDVIESFADGAVVVIAESTFWFSKAVALMGLGGLVIIAMLVWRGIRWAGGYPASRQLQLEKRDAFELSLIHI